MTLVFVYFGNCSNMHLLRIPCLVKSAPRYVNAMRPGSFFLTGENQMVKSVFSQVQYNVSFTVNITTPLSST